MMERRKRSLKFAASMIGVFSVCTAILYLWNLQVMNKSRIAGLLPLFRDKPIQYSTQQQDQLSLTISDQSLSFHGKEQEVETEQNTAYTEAAQKCKFEATFEENLQYIKSYNLDEALPYMDKLQLYSDPVPSSLSRAKLKDSNITTPIFVTALSSNHFQENLDLLENINTVVRPVMGNIKVLVYDLGINSTERDKISEACHCQVRTFPFADLPEHLILKGNSWKPIIVQLALKEHPFVIWVDSSIRFLTGNLTKMVEMAMVSGILALGPVSGSIARYTHQQTFETLKEPRCLYEKYAMFPSTMLAVFAKDYILEGIVEPWVKCALVERCMQTTESYDIIINCTNLVCHRYDQSVVNILIGRLFYDAMEQVFLYQCDILFTWRPRYRQTCTHHDLIKRKALPWRLIST